MMSQWREDIRRRLADTDLDPAREADVIHEIEGHLDDRYAELRAAGWTEADARRAALDDLRDHGRLTRELARLAPRRPAPFPPGDPVRRAVFADRAQDVRYAIRMLRRTPGFTLAAILTLALGIGASVAIASAVYTVLYRPLPIVAADRLVVPVSTNPARDILRGSVPFADYADWRRETDVFEEVALFTPTAVDISGAAEPERIDGLQVSPGFFAVLKAQALAGRLFLPEDHVSGAPRVLVLSEGLWRRRFGSSPDVVGSQIRLGGTPAQVLGVVPAEAAWPTGQDVWLPMPIDALPEDILTRRDNMIFLAIARLREGASLTQARARVSAIADRVARDHPESRTGWSTDLIPLREYIVEPEIRLGMLALLGGVAFVLLIACVNLANLLLARGADRAREIAVRTALGASRGRLIRQMTTESLVLAAAGGIAGLILARWLLEGLKAAAPEDLPMLAAMSIDGVAVAAAVAISALAAVLFGLFPALALSSLQPAGALREGTRTSGGRAGGRVRDLLAVAQMALAIVLLIGAGLMVRSVGLLMRIDPGVDVERILAGRVALPSARYDPPRRVQFYEQLIDALAATPGVEAAAATSYLPAGGRGFGLGRVFLLEGQPEPPASEDHPAFWNVVTPDYFRTLGIPLRRGRTFTRQDAAESTPVMIINETMARRVFGSGEPLGRRMRSWRDENLLREIVGVVADVRYSGLGDEARSLVYVPHQQNQWGSMTVAVRAQGNPAPLASTVKSTVAKLDPDLAVARVRTLASLAADSIAPQRFGALLILLFAAAAALLAGTGVYGVMSYAVAQRRHEFGIRLALGATPTAVFRLIMRRGLMLGAAGAGLGLAGGLAIAPSIRSLLFGVGPHDPATLLVVPLILLGVALTASAVPGRRAARIDPVEAIRE